MCDHCRSHGITVPTERCWTTLRCWTLDSCQHHLRMDSASVPWICRTMLLVSTTGSSGGGWSGQFEDLERLEGSRNELDRLRKRLAAFPTSAMEDEAMLLSMDAPLGDTERLIVRFRKQRKLAITSFIRKLEVRLEVAGSKPLNVWMQIASIDSKLLAAVQCYVNNSIQKVQDKCKIQIACLLQRSITANE